MLSTKNLDQLACWKNKHTVGHREKLWYSEILGVVCRYSTDVASSGGPATRWATQP